LKEFNKGFLVRVLVLDDTILFSSVDFKFSICVLFFSFFVHVKLPFGCLNVPLDCSVIECLLEGAVATILNGVFVTELERVSGVFVRTVVLDARPSIADFVDVSFLVCNLYFMLGLLFCWIVDCCTLLLPSTF
jgi:hypothetical protein